MRLEGQRDLPGTVEEARRALRDPDVLRAVLPHCRELTPVGPDHVVVTFGVQAGPLSDTFRGMVTVTETADGLQASADAHGRTGRLAVEVRVRLEEVTTARTTMRYAADVTLGGLVARAITSGVDVTGRRIATQLVADLGRVLVEQRTAPAPV